MILPYKTKSGETLWQDMNEVADSQKKMSHFPCPISHLCLFSFLFELPTEFVSICTVIRKRDLYIVS